jgi:glycosyltransferase involved in cell wall biosynthesis
MATLDASVARPCFRNNSAAMTAIVEFPTVSVIIPAYQTADFIAEAVESVLFQTFQSYEIIVVNDRSPDTPELERALAPFRDRVTYIVRERNGGLAAARNTGIRVARGRYIALLDSDDAWERDYLVEQVGMLEADPTLAMVYANARIVGDHPHAGRTFMDVCPSAGEVTVESLITGQCTVFVSVLVRREALVRAGLFDENLRSVEDFEMWVRLLASGERIGYQRRVLARHLKRRGSLSADPVAMAQYGLEVLDKIARLPLTERDLEAVRQGQKHFQARLDLARGKLAFFRLDTGAALEHVNRANEYFKTYRLSVVCALIRTAPRFLLRLYRLRDRYIVKADTSF